MACHLRLIFDWADRQQNQVIAVRNPFSVGLPVLGATEHGGSGVPDGQYFAWLGQFQLAHRYANFHDVQMLFRADMQLAASPLLTLEQFGVGGAQTVRGYRENQLVRDNGFVGSLEFRIPVLHSESGVSRLQFAVFGDFGASWNTDRPTPDPETLGSAGLGFRWDPTDTLHAQVYWAHPFTTIDVVGQDLQDEGISFQLYYQPFF